MKQWPRILAIVGCVTCSRASTVSGPSIGSARPSPDAIASRSLPAQNERPAPVSTTQRTARVAGDRVEVVPQLVERRRVQRVQLLGSVERQRRHPVGIGPQHHRHGIWLARRQGWTRLDGARQDPRDTTRGGRSGHVAREGCRHHGRRQRDRAGHGPGAGAKGAKLVLADVEERALDAAVQGLRDGGAEAHGVVCDVRSLDAVNALADASFSAVGGVHVVFNNAGIAVGGPVLAMTHDDWRWTIDVDLWGPIHGVEAFLPRIVEQGEGGHVLFTASFAGLVPNSGLGPYCVAKYGVVALAEVLWRELREHRIGVSVLCPMRVGTNIGQSERNRQTDYGETAPGSRVADQDSGNDELAGPRAPGRRRRRAHRRRRSSRTASTCSRTRRAGSRSAAASPASTGRSTSSRRRSVRRCDGGEQRASCFTCASPSPPSGSRAAWPRSMRSATLRPAAVSSRMRKRLSPFVVRRRTNLRSTSFDARTDSRGSVSPSASATTPCGRGSRTASSSCGADRREALACRPPHRGRR